MGETLAYLRPVFVERQGLFSKKSGGGTAAIVVAGALAGLTPLLLSVRHHHPNFGTMLWVMVGTVAIVATPLLVLTSAITIVVEPSQLRLSMTVGPIRLWRKMIPLAEVRGCEVVRPGEGMAARPGWKLPAFRGVALLRFTGGETYVMARGGRPAVVLAVGKFGGYVIGSERPEELAAAIRAGLSAE